MGAIGRLPEHDDLLRRAEALIAGGRSGAARPILAALASRNGPCADLSRVAARADLRDGKVADALAILDPALDAAPEDVSLRMLRAEARLLAGDRVGAATDAAEAVVLEPAGPHGKALLGIALMQLGRPGDAALCLAEAVRSAPAEPGYIQALAAALEANGDVADARTALAAGIATCPGAAILYGAAMLLELRQREFDAAVALGESARNAGIADACVSGLLGHALSSLARHDDAAEAYQQALRLGPDDPYVRHLVAASGALPGGDRAPEAYVRAVFDGCADRFDEHLISLGYRVPGLVRRALLNHLAPCSSLPDPVPVLDLGCGTGLLAVVCADLPLGPWRGIDLSPGMLAQARAKGLYAELHESELVAALEQDTRGWPLVLAGDVLCYFGALEAVFTAVFSRLRPGGLFVFSLEEQTGGSGWALGARGRYLHSSDYLAETARSSGFDTRAIDRQTLRCEAGAPVPGLLVVLARPQ